MILNNNHNLHMRKYTFLEKYWDSSKSYEWKTDISVSLAWLNNEFTTYEAPNA